MKNLYEAQRNNNYCPILLLDEENGYLNILKFWHVEKSIQLPFVVYANFERSLEKQDNCKNDP